jgi:hypothetical protein
VKETHPLKRKSIKPSSSTVRGMLPGPQFRALDAAMQSLRSAGMRLDWAWKSKDIGWVCLGLINEQSACELRPTQDPLVGWVELNQEQLTLALDSDDIPKKFKNILKAPMEETKSISCYEIPLETTAMRDLFSDFVEALIPIFEYEAK